MDKLSTAVLIMLFALGGSGLTLATFLLFILSGIASFNHISVFFLSLLFVYCMYGVIGLIILSVCSLSMLLCGIVYWYDLSYSSIKKSLNSVDSMNNTTQDLTFNLDVDKKINELSEYRKNYTDKIFNTIGLTGERIIRIQSVYKLISISFDKLCGLVYTYCEKFRETTNGVAGLKIVYVIIDYIVSLWKGIGVFKNLHKVSRSMQSSLMNMDKIINSRIPTDNTNKIKHETGSKLPTNNTDNTQPMLDKTVKVQKIENNKCKNKNKNESNNIGIDMLNIGNMNDEIQKMQEYYNKMDPSQRKQIEELTIQLLGDMPIDAMFGDLGQDMNKKHKKK